MPIARTRALNATPTHRIGKPVHALHDQVGLMRPSRERTTADPHVAEVEQLKNEVVALKGQIAALKKANASAEKPISDGGRLCP
jgi:hypothetical protein